MQDQNTAPLIVASDLRLGFNANHTTDVPTQVYSERLHVLHAAAVDRATKLWGYPETEMWTVSLRSDKHSYEVHKPKNVRHSSAGEFVVFRDGKRVVL